MEIKWNRLAVATYGAIEYLEDDGQYAYVRNPGGCSYNSDSIYKAPGKYLDG